MDIGGLSEGLGGILFHLNLFDADGDVGPVLGGDPISRLQGDAAIAGERLVILRNLIPRGLVPVEIMFPVEAADGLDVAVEGQRGAQSGDQGLLLKNRLASGYGQVEEGDARVGFLIKGGAGAGAGRGEELLRGIQLGVDLDSYGELPAIYDLIVGVFLLFLSRGLLFLGLVLELFS